MEFKERLSIPSRGGAEEDASQLQHFRVHQNASGEGGTKMRLGGNQNAKIKQAVFLAAEFGDVLGGLSRKQKHVGDDWKKCHEFHFYKNHENAARCCFKEILFVVTVATFSTTP